MNHMKPTGTRKRALFVRLRGKGNSSGKWFILPSAIPGRICCPLLHILPNGIKAEVGDPLLNTAVILPGIGISVIWFGIATALFLYWFRKFEVNQKC